MSTFLRIGFNGVAVARLSMLTPFPTELICGQASVIWLLMEA